MKITGKKGYVDIEYNGKTARFWGDMCLHGFSALASTMEWMSPTPTTEVDPSEKASLIKDVKSFCKRQPFKITFRDDNGKTV